MATYYTNEHEWISVEGDVGTVGITKFAAEKLGDVVFVELPDAGKQVKKDADMAVVESVKAASDVYAPIAGEVVAANESLARSVDATLRAGMLSGAALEFLAGVGVGFDGAEAGLLAARAAWLAGFAGTATVAAGRAGV